MFGLRILDLSHYKVRCNLRSNFVLQARSRVGLGTKVAYGKSHTKQTSIATS